MTGERDAKRPEPTRLPKRFYKAVTVAAVLPLHVVPMAGFDTTGGVQPRDKRGGNSVRVPCLLDGKPMRTPAKKEFLLPTRALADAVAAEWEAQTDRIDPATMPLTRLANSAIDGVMGREAEVRADIVKYAGSDLVCYRAEGPPELVRRQAEAWDPVLAWAREALGARFHVTQGIMPAAQPAPAAASVARAIEAHRGLRSGGPARHDDADGLGPAGAGPCSRAPDCGARRWAAAHVDEDWQISQWGEDAEAKARRERRWQEMQAASRLIQLLG